MKHLRGRLRRYPVGAGDSATEIVAGRIDMVLPRLGLVGVELDNGECVMVRAPAGAEMGQMYIQQPSGEPSVLPLEDFCRLTGMIL